MKVRDILASEGLVAAVEPSLKKALAAWKNTFSWDNDQAKRKGKTVLVKKTSWTSGTPDFSSLVDTINSKFFVGSGYKIEVQGPSKTSGSLRSRTTPRRTSRTRSTRSSPTAPRRPLRVQS